MLLPELNAYITTLGGADYKWTVLGLWTISALFMRPFSGKIADNLGRKRVMYIGICISIVVSFLYPVFQFLTGFFMLRLVHGASTGFHPTGATALVADYIPPGKRGQAMGIFSALVAIGFSAGQGLGSPVKQAFGMDGLFYTCGGLGIASLLLLAFIDEDKSKLNKIEGSIWKNIIPKPSEIISPNVVRPAVIMLITAAIAGVYMFIVPEFSEHLNIENKGSFYLYNVLFVVVVRVFAGRLADTFGPTNNLYFGLTLIVVAAFVTGTATTSGQFLFSSVLYGIAAGVISPSLFAWTADLSDPRYKGRGMATLFLSLEAGFFIGAFMTQQIYKNDPANFFKLFLFVAGLSVIGLVYLFLANLLSKNKSDE